MKLTYGQTYVFEVLADWDGKLGKSGMYPECGHPSKITACIKILARPYDLIYIVTNGD